MRQANRPPSYRRIAKLRARLCFDPEPRRLQAFLTRAHPRIDIPNRVGDADESPFSGRTRSRADIRSGVENQTRTRRVRAAQHDRGERRVLFVERGVAISFRHQSPAPRDRNCGRERKSSVVVESGGTRTPRPLRYQVEIEVNAVNVLAGQERDGMIHPVRASEPQSRRSHLAE